MKYKIFVDTNQVFFSNKAPLNEVFSNSIPELRSFLQEHNLDIPICLPEIVIRERIQQRLEDVAGTVQSVNDALNKLLPLKHKTAQIKSRKDYLKTLSQNADSFLQEHSVTKVPVPSITKNELIDRAILKRRPFNDNSAGFKDTLIYLSIVEDALGEESADRYIFCTNDSKEFTEDVVQEFRECTAKELYIVKNMEEVREKLDTLVPLSLHLEERNREIRNLVFKHLGDLMHLANKSIKPASSRWGGPLDYSSRVFRTVHVDSVLSGENNSEDKIEGLNYQNLSLLSITEMAGGRFKVNGTLEVEIQYQDKDRDANPYDVVWRTNWGMGSYRPQHKTFDVLFVCSLTDNTVDIEYVNSMFA